MIRTPSQTLCSGLRWMPLLLAAALAARATADDFSLRDPLITGLSKPMTSIVDGRSFRDGLSRIAGQAGVNLCLDRRVDPSRLIEVGPVGPTVFAAMEKLASAHDCVVMPVSNMVLIGRPSWVDQTTASILSLPAIRNRAIAHISWNDLTTPTEALARAHGTGIESEPPLPYDLWPATSWTRIDRRVAVTLVLAQFDRRPQFSSAAHAASSTQLSWIKANDTDLITRRYPQDERANSIRKQLAENAPESRVRVAAGKLQISGRPAAHRLAVAALLATAAAAAAPDPDRDTFTLRKMSTSAENALRQLAQSAGKTCVIEEGAEQACQKIVSIEGKDVTLRKLINMVAAQAGVVADWRGDSIVISKP